MSNTRIITCALAVAGVLFIGSQARAQIGPSSAGLEPFDAPGAAMVSSPVCAPSCGTAAFDVNDLGEIVGYYTDPNIVPHGFLRLPNGQFIYPIDAPAQDGLPGAGLGHGLNQGTAAEAINDLGEIVGQFQDPKYVYHGFVRYPDGHFTTFDDPNAGTQANLSQGFFPGTIAWDINLSGTTAGIYIDANNVQHGFIRSPANKFTKVDPTGSVYTYPCPQTCLTPDGTLTGFYIDMNNVAHGFVRRADGTFTPPIDAPAPAIQTEVLSINAKGEIAGVFLDSNSRVHGFVRHSDGSFTTFEDPEAGPFGTSAFSINLVGATTGVYFDASGNQLGFERFPDGRFANFFAPNAGPGNGLTGGTRPQSNNVEGEVTGFYIDANGLNHGFFWIPGTSLVGNQQ